MAENILVNEKYPGLMKGREGYILKGDLVATEWIKVSVPLYVTGKIEAGWGIKAGRGIEAGWGIEAGEGIEAGLWIKAGEGIEAGGGGQTEGKKGLREKHRFLYKNGVILGCAYYDVFY